MINESTLARMAGDIAGHLAADVEWFHMNPKERSKEADEIGRLSVEIAVAVARNALGKAVVPPFDQISEVKP